MQSILHGIAQAFTKFYVFCGSEITDFRSPLSLQGERATEEHIWRHQRCQEDCRGRIKNGQAGSHYRWQCKSSSWWRFLQAKCNFNACVAWCDPPIFKRRQHLGIILQFVALKYAVKLWILRIFALFLSFEDPMCVNLLCCSSHQKSLVHLGASYQHCSSQSIVLRCCGRRTSLLSSQWGWKRKTWLFHLDTHPFSFWKHSAWKAHTTALSSLGIVCALSVLSFEFSLFFFENVTTHQEA